MEQQKQIDRLERLIIQLQTKVDDLERKCYRLEDDLRNVRYTAEEADRKAQTAEAEAQRAQRGW